MRSISSIQVWLNQSLKRSTQKTSRGEIIFRIKGIAEVEKESWDEVESKVKDANKAKLDLDILDIDTERAQCVERRKKRGSTNANEPRTIVCNLRDWKQCEQVLRKAWKEKPVYLHITKVVAFSTLKKRQARLEKFKDGKQVGKIAHFELHCLVIRDKPDG